MTHDQGEDHCSQTGLDGSIIYTTEGTLEP